MSNVQLSNKPVFYYNPANGAIWQGLPEQFPPPLGWQKIVCTSAHEAEMWSERMRKWDQLTHQMTMDEREQVEGPMREELRSSLRHQMANARNNVNRDFLQRAMETLDAQASKWKYKRESYMHAEAFENGR